MSRQVGTMYGVRQARFGKGCQVAWPGVRRFDTTCVAEGGRWPRIGRPGWMCALAVAEYREARPVRGQGAARAVVDGVSRCVVAEDALTAG